MFGLTVANGNQITLLAKSTVHEVYFDLFSLTFLTGCRASPHALNDSSDNTRIVLKYGSNLAPGAWVGG